MLDVLQESDLIRRVTRKVYWNSRYARLRTQIEEDDLVQIVFLKLLSNDNYKRYSEDYSLKGFIWRVANGCAITCSNKRSNLREWTVLEQPKSRDDESSVSLLDLLVSDTPKVEVSLDQQFRINRVAASMNPAINPNFIIRYNDEDIPFSMEHLFDFFMETQFSREEMRSHIINLKTNSLVTHTTFDKWWNRLVKTAMKELSR